MVLTLSPADVDGEWRPRYVHSRPAYKDGVLAWDLWRILSNESSLVFVGNRGGFDLEGILESMHSDEQCSDSSMLGLHIELTWFENGIWKLGI